MRIVDKKIGLEKLQAMSQKMFDDLVKAVVDIEKEIMVIDAPMHADQEGLLLEKGSNQKNLWGINLYSKKYPAKNWIEFDSMINLRPSLGNRSRGVENLKIRQKIIKIVNKLVQNGHNP